MNAVDIRDAICFYSACWVSDEFKKGTLKDGNFTADELANLTSPGYWSSRGHDDQPGPVQRFTTQSSLLSRRGELGLSVNILMPECIVYVSAATLSIIIDQDHRHITFKDFKPAAVVRAEYYERLKLGREALAKWYYGMFDPLEHTDMGIEPSDWEHINTVRTSVNSTYTSSRFMRLSDRAQETFDFNNRDAGVAVVRFSEDGSVDRIGWNIWPVGKFEMNNVVGPEMAKGYGGWA